MSQDFIWYDKARMCFFLRTIPFPTPFFTGQNLASGFQCVCENEHIASISGLLLHWTLRIY